jgi:hypothetical protein
VYQYLPDHAEILNKYRKEIHYHFYPFSSIQDTNLRCISKICECMSKVDVAKGCHNTVCAHPDCELQPGSVVTSMLHTVVDNFGVGEEGYQRCQLLCTQCLFKIFRCTTMRGATYK